SDAMGESRFTRKGGRVKTWSAALLLVSWAVPALGGGGEVLPPTAKPKGVSLADMAGATAVFNTGVRSPDTVPATPFQILYVPTDRPSFPFVVSPGTMLYVPLVFSDDSPPVVGDFPDVSHQAAVADYFFDQNEFGAVFLDIIVDGK